MLKELLTYKSYLKTNNLIYSRNLYTDHLNTNFLRFGFQMVVLCPMYPDHSYTGLVHEKTRWYHLSGIQMVRLSGNQTAFKYQTIWRLTWPFKYQTSPLFRSPLYFHLIRTFKYQTSPLFRSPLYFLFADAKNNLVE